MEEKNELENSVKEADAAVLTDAEKEKIYQRALCYLSSSLTNDELFEESLNALLTLGNYKHSASLYTKYSAQYKARLEEREALLKKRKSGRFWQGVVVAVASGVILMLVLLLVFLLKLDIVR